MTQNITQKVVYQTTMYYASLDDRTIVYCFLENQEIGLPPRKMMQTKVEVLSSQFPPLSTSVYTIKLSVWLLECKSKVNGVLDVTEQALEMLQAKSSGLMHELRKLAYGQQVWTSESKVLNNPNDFVEVHGITVVVPS